MASLQSVADRHDVVIVCRLRMRWHRRFDQYADAVFIAGLRDGAGSQGWDRERANASDSTFNAA